MPRWRGAAGFDETAGRFERDCEESRERSGRRIRPETQVRVLEDIYFEAIGA